VLQVAYNTIDLDGIEPFGFAAVISPPQSIAQYA